MSEIAKLWATIGADISPLEKGLVGAQSTLGKAAGAIGKVGLVAGGIAFAGIGALAAAIGVSVAEASEAQQGIAQLDAVIKSTGGKAGVTRDQVLGLADAIQKTTKFADDDVIAASNMMLTFTNIGKNVFPQATTTAMDMAQALGTDSKQAAMMLGKALNDPIQGVTALRRVGVQLSDAQEKQVKQFMAVNDVASAQKVILGELQTEFGGSAEAAGNTFAGKMAILGHTFDDVKEKIGNGVMPALTTLADKFATWLNDPTVQKGIEDIAKGLADFATNVVPKAIDAVTTLATTLSSGGDPFTTITSGVTTFLTTLGMAPADAATAATDIANAFVTLQDIGTTIGDVANKIATAISTGDWTPITTMVGEWAGKFLSWVQTDVIPFIGEKVNEFATAVGTWITTNVPLIAERMREWAEKFLSWVETDVTPYISEKLGALWTTISTWVTGKATEFKPVFDGWVAAATAWITDAVADAPEKLGQLYQKVYDWVQETVGKIKDEMPKLAKTLTTWISEKAVPWLKDEFPKFIAAFVAVVVGIPLALAVVIGTIALAIVNSLVDSLKQFIAEKAAEFVKIAAGIIDGIVKGFNDAKQQVIDALLDIIKSARDSVLAFFGIHSPSTVFAEIGNSLGAGVAVGILGSMSMVQSAMGQLSQAAMFTPPTASYAFAASGSASAPAAAGYGGSYRDGELQASGGAMTATVNVYLDGKLIERHVTDMVYQSLQGAY